MTVARTTHGQSHSPLYMTWIAMINRCECATSGPYKQYGARGIKICAAWRANFGVFASAVGPRPSPHHSLDRINVNGDYEPGNVRWATRAEQQHNKRCSRRVAFNGITKTVGEWATDLGMRDGTLYSRLFLYGWDVARALTEPVHEEKRHVSRA